MWYEERGRQAVRSNKPPPSFPLENRQTDLIQVLSIFEPIAELNIKCRAERAEEVDVLVALYMSRLNELGQDQPVRHYQPTYVNPQWISASISTPLTSKTRDVSRAALDKSHFVLEMILKVYPIYMHTAESLSRVVIKGCRQHGKTGRKTEGGNDKVPENILELLRTVPELTEVSHGRTVFLNVRRIEARFAPRIARPTTTSRADHRAENELDRLTEDPIDVERNEDVTPKESVLQFWKRHKHSGEYRIILKARDFSVSGEMVSSQRTGFAGDTVDMSIFLNSERVDLL
ncbi:Hypothetical protein PHPALM_19991 [Phytophthora palmivora]|uniref:Uncharacterized protein n=1 Tax=Phytophthora palmivora TaxID=4796 RepID=A0A2P4XG00_9STRA|nr:Hypothetical protein PHPALM_19991 [Phytophthora palmivora]